MSVQETRVLLLQSRCAAQDFARFPALLELLQERDRERFVAAAFTLIDPERPDHADTLTLLLDELGWEQVVLVASGTDAVIAAAIAAEIPDRIGGLFLIRPQTDSFPDLPVPGLIVTRHGEKAPLSRFETCRSETYTPEQLSELLHAFCCLRTAVSVS